MKKSIFIIMCAVGAIVCSCGNRTQQNTDELDSMEAMMLSDSVVAQLDSMASILCEVADSCNMKVVFSSGNVALTNEQEHIEPDYLLTEKDINDLVTLRQKYVAMAYLAIDNSVQQLYYSSDDEYYNNAMTRLAAETDAANQKAAKAAEGKALTLENAKEFYADMKARNRLDKFYVAEAAYCVEALYIISCNVDAYMPAISNATAKALCQRLRTAVSGVELIANNHPDMKPVTDALHLINGINATTAAELKTQIEASNKVLTEARSSLLKK